MVEDFVDVIHLDVEAGIDTSLGEGLDVRIRFSDDGNGRMLMRLLTDGVEDMVLFMFIFMRDLVGHWLNFG